LRIEARAAAGLQHPGITVVHDFGDHQGRPYIVMELLDGKDLGSVLAAHGSGLEVAEALRLLIQVADALAYAHDKGVIHRDIKPANLMRLAGGVVKICDFGIAQAPDATRMTAFGAVLGTPAFMAPEQFDGEPASVRTDLYAFGVTLFAVLTGKPPNRHLEGRPAVVRELRADVPGGIDDLLQALLEKDPAARPASARQVRDALQAALEPGREHPSARLRVTVPEFVLAHHHKHQARSIAFNPDGRSMAAISTAWNRLSLCELDTGSRRGDYLRIRYSGLAPVVTFSPDGQHVAAGDRRIRVWDVRSRTVRIELRSHNGYAQCLAFRPDGHALAIATWHRNITVWDVRTGARILGVPGHPGIVRSLAFSPDGRTLASTGGGEHGYEAVTLWDAASGTRLHQLTWKAHEVHAVAFHPAGGLITTGDGDDRVRVWDVRTGETVRELTGHQGPIRSVAYSMDGSLLAGGGTDQKIHLWDTGTGEHIAQLTGHPSTVRAVAFSHRRTLMTASQDGTVITWERANGSHDRPVHASRRTD
jgi:hypothetical protein